MKPYFSDASATLYRGDALAVASELPSGSVDCIVTSPPYLSLRDYGVEGQYGLEESPAEYVEVMRRLFAELRRVLAGDGTCWINLGDSYDSEKNLIGIPWMVSFALSADGWIRRNAIVWKKLNAMPEPVKDRLSTTYEMVFMFSPNPKYWFDLDPIREPHDDAAVARWGGRNPHGARGAEYKIGADGKSTNGLRAHPTGHNGHLGFSDGGKNPGDVWSIQTRPFPNAHFAVMPPELAERCIQAGCKPGGVVLDPFSGSGTTGMAAAKHGRKYIGIDLNSEYLDLSLRTRLLQPGLFEEGA